MKMTVTLTVAESKRLIAKGVAAHPAVRQALENGLVAIAKGTTNGYVAEEILGQQIPKRDYVLGRTVPKKAAVDPPITANYADIVLEKGKRVEGATIAEAVGQMQAGDVFIKGANALNYERAQAGVLVGHPTGGTLGATLGTVISRKIEFIVPVGLEKSIPGDLDAIAAHVTGQDVGESADAAETVVVKSPAEADLMKGSVPSLWVVPGQIFTEIEALATLARAEAVPVSAGGVVGAEGAIWLLVHGSKTTLETVEAIIDKIQGAPPF